MLNTTKMTTTDEQKREALELLEHLTLAIENGESTENRYDFEQAIKKLRVARIWMI